MVSKPRSQAMFPHAQEALVVAAVVLFVLCGILVSSPYRWSTPVSGGCFAASLLLTLAAYI